MSSMKKSLENGKPWCQVLMDKMDSNGDGMLQEEEFCMFLGAAVMRERMGQDDDDDDKDDETREAEEIDKETKKKMKGILEVLNCELPVLDQ
jgi:hypothetical protein